MFDKLKAHQRGPRMVIRPQSHDFFKQEIWAHLCCHNAIRTLMVEAAQHAHRDPDRVSFVAALRIARPSVAQGVFRIRSLITPQVAPDARIESAHPISSTCLESTGPHSQRI